MKKGKKYEEVAKLVERNKAYTKEEAVSLVKKTNPAKFDASVEVAVALNLDTKKAEQQLRGTLVLPNGNGKNKIILVIAKGPKAAEAKEAGADFVGDIDMLEKIEKENWFGFDTLIATPDMMPALGKLGKVLGPKGLMPNPKTGTVTMDVKKAVEEIKAGRIEYRTDSYGNLHVNIGKVSFEEDKLMENLNSFMTLVYKTKPSVVKGTYVKNVSLSSTMGPGIKIDTNSFDR